MTHVTRRGLVGAVDLGGTKILSAVIDSGGVIVGEDLRPTDAGEGPESVLRRVAASLQAAHSAAGGDEPLLAAGVAAPGPIDFARGVVVSAPNLGGWQEVPIVQVLSGLLGIPVIIENDANAAAWGEFAFGAGMGSSTMVYLTVSTGIGGGLVLDGRLFRGARGGAGELGHMQLVDGGPRCGCGAHGCLEQLASGTAIAREGRAAVASGYAPVLARLAGGSAVTAEMVHEAAEQRDPDAQRIIATAGRHLGRGLVAIVNIFDPEVIVIGGGAAKIGPLLLGPAEDELRAYAMGVARDHVRLVPAALGDRAGALGVAALARGR